MKRNFICLLGVFFILTSCNKVIDKRVSIETAKEDIKEIKEKYKDEYTDADFEAMTAELTGNVFKMALTKGDVKDMKFEKTYKEYLDEAKAARVKSEKIIHELNSAAKLTIDNFSRVQGTGFASEYDVNMDVTITILNNNSKTISGITGRFEVTDMFDKKIENLGFEYTDPIKPKEKLTEEYSYEIGFVGDLKDLNQSAFEKLKFKWIPEKIVFADGSYLPKE